MIYLIEMAWFCWDCAENIGASFIEDERKAKEGERCYQCKRRV